MEQKAALYGRIKFNFVKVENSQCGQLWPELWQICGQRRRRNLKNEAISAKRNGFLGMSHGRTQASGTSARTTIRCSEDDNRGKKNAPKEWLESWARNNISDKGTVTAQMTLYPYYRAHCDTAMGHIEDALLQAINKLHRPIHFGERKRDNNCRSRELYQWLTERGLSSPALSQKTFNMPSLRQAVAVRDIEWDYCAAISHLNVFLRHQMLDEPSRGCCLCSENLERPWSRTTSHIIRACVAAGAVCRWCDVELTPEARIHLTYARP